MEVAGGDTFVADTDDGHRPVTVVEVTEDFVKVDANHPLAGVNLHFSVAVRDVPLPKRSPTVTSMAPMTIT